MKRKLLVASALFGASLIAPSLPALAQTAGPTAVTGPTAITGPTAVTGTQPVVGPTAGTNLAPASQAQPLPTRPPLTPGAAVPTLPPTRPPLPGTTTTTPRAGGFPTGLALPLLLGGATALGGGIYLLRRGRRP